MLVESLERVEVGVKSPIFNYNQRFSLLVKPNFINNFCYTALYMFDLFVFGPTFDIFHYAKLPSYKRVKCSRLAEPSNTV